MARINGRINPQLQSRLLSLPTELVIQVVSELSEDRSSLCSLAQTCRRLHPLCEEHIYAIIILLSTDDLRAILNAFSRRFERIAAVHTLKILYKFHEELAATVEERKAFNTCIGHMTGLKDWHVESPYDNFKWESGGDNWVEHDMVDFQLALEKASSHASLGQRFLADVALAKLSKRKLIMPP